MTIRRLIGAGAVLIIPAVIALTVFSYVRRPRLTPALRGAELAARFGCFACHGPGGTGGIPNPGSEDGEVPAWDGGTSMMYVKNEEEIREWILYGRPKRLMKEREAGHAQGGELVDGHTHDDSAHPREKPAVAENTRASLPLEMPAFEHRISSRQLEDLVAYYKAVATFERQPPEARKGRRIAARLGCFGCHGPGGRVGSRNPRSFKGYIPPWRGRDYAELVRNDDELRQWILDGGIDRFEANPVARFFTRRQIIQMPAYRELLRDGELDALIAYIHWLQETGS